MIEITTSNFEGNQYRVKLIAVPDTCPICKRHVDPRLITSFLDYKGYEPTASLKSLYVVFLCPAIQCRSLFIGAYQVTGHSNQFAGHPLDSGPFRVVKEKEFPKAITQLSPRFSKIYNQSLQAEENGLDEICGPGYRKALEYLVKDYLAKYTFKDDLVKQEEVASSKLGLCIEKYIEEKRIKTSAKLAAWLGNDETHYVRKWMDKDLSDLKALISMTVSWIDLVVQSDNYDSTMSPGQKKKNDA